MGNLMRGGRCSTCSLMFKKALATVPHKKWHSPNCELQPGPSTKSPQLILESEGKKRGLVSVHFSAILIGVITLQIEHSRNALLAEEQNELYRRSIKQRERGIYLKKKKIKGSSWHGHHLALSAGIRYGIRALQERLFGPRAALLDGYPSYWHPMQPDFICKWAKPKSIRISLILYMWKNSWWVKQSITFNPCSVFGEKKYAAISPSPLLSSMDDGFYLMLYLHDFKKIKSPQFWFDNVSELVRVFISD